MSAALHLHEGDPPLQRPAYPDREVPTKPGVALGLLDELIEWDDEHDAPTAPVDVPEEVSAVRSSPKNPEPLSDVIARLLEQLRREERE